MINFSRKYLLVISISLLCSIDTYAQNKIVGRVIDENSQVVDAAVVILMSEKDKALIETAVTDTKGIFFFNKGIGPCIIYVRFLGYGDILQTVNVTGNMKLPDIQLVPVATNLSEVTITARQRRPLTKSINGKVQIDVSKSYLTDIGNALDVLKHSPGISVNHKGEIALSTLGGTALYINGKRIMLQGEELASYLRSLPSTKIERIEASAIPNAQYDTDGAGGVINIVLKSNDSSGFFITTSHGVSYWENLRENSDLSVSYNTDKWQLGVNYNHAIGHYSMEYGSDKTQDDIRNLSETNDIDKRNTYSGGVDFVWSPNDRHKLSLNTSFNQLSGPGKTSTETNIYNNTNSLVQILHAENDYIKQRNLRYGGNINYRFTPSKKSSLSLAADWIRFEGLSKNNQPNSYCTPNNTHLRTDLYYSEPHKDIDIYSFMADYKYVSKGGSEILTGFKTSAIRSDNDFQFKSNGVFNITRSNKFNYTENNWEGYFQYTKGFGKWSLSGGLRLEYMYTDGKLQPYDETALNESNSKKTFSIFPNLSLSYSISDQIRISAQYSKRQDKPKYEDLNPFEYLLDELTYWKGNPFLKPQINNKFSLNFSMRQLAINLSYSRLSDYFASLTDVYGAGRTIMSTKNIGNQEQVGLELVYSRRLVSWWDISSNMGLYYFINRLDYETYKEDYKRPSLTLSINNDIALPYNVRLEVTGRYYSKRQGGSYEVIKANGSLDIGISRTFMKNRLRLSLLMNDVFHTERWDSYGKKGNLDITSWGYGESRQLIFRVRYNFGTQKYKTNDTKIEELNRL